MVLLVFISNKSGMGMYTPRRLSQTPNLPYCAFPIGYIGLLFSSLMIVSHYPRIVTMGKSHADRNSAIKFRSIYISQITSFNDSLSFCL